MNLKNIKCIILDIDGTLANSRSEVTNYTKNIIKKLVVKNIMVVLASGRNVDSVIEMSRDCGASSIVIADNGSVIYDYSKREFLFLNVINEKFLGIIWELCLKYNIDSIYNSLHRRYRNYKCLDERYNEKNDIVIKDVTEIKSDIYQIVLLGDNIHKFNLCVNAAKENGFKIANISHESIGINFADINLKCVSKGIAIRKLRKFLNIEKNNIICFGDSMNDIEMFNNCGIKVAMKNSIAELKQNADYVTKYTNDEDGVAKFLKKHFDL